MPDETIEILIKTVLAGDGIKLTSQQIDTLRAKVLQMQKDIAAASQAGYGTAATARQMLSLQSAIAPYAQHGTGSPPFLNLPVSPGWGEESETPSSGGGGGGRGMGYAMRRHWGAVAGRMLGVSGGGLLLAAGGMAAVFGGVALALEKVVSRFQAWKNAINETVAAWSKLETAGQSLDTMAVRQQRMNQHTEQFALSLAQIDRQVQTTTAQVKHYVDLEETQIGFEQRLDDARTQRMRSEAELQTRFNPIDRIRQLETIEEEAFQRRLNRERQMEQIRLKGIEMERDLAGARGGLYAHEAAGIKAGLDPLEKRAAAYESDRGITEGALDLSVSRYEKLRLALKRLIAGQGAGGAYREARDVVLAEGDESRDDLDKLLLDPTTNASVLTGAGAVPDSVKKAAAAQLARIGTGLEGETGTRLSAIRDKRMVARAKASAAAFVYQQQLRRLGYSEDEINKSTSEFKSSEMQRQMLEQKIGTEEQFRPSIESETIQGLRTKEQLDILNSIKPPNLPPTGGGASINGDGADRIIAVLREIWMT